MPETCFDAKTGVNWEAFGRHYNEGIAPKLTEWAAEQVRRGSLPQKPDDYKVATSAAFKPPQGVEFKIDEANPLWPQARAWAQKTGLSQDQFAEAIDLVAGMQVGDQQKIATARTAEIGKLGTTATARVDAISTWLDGMGVPGLKGRMWTAQDVQDFEKIISKSVSQGAASFSQAHREPAAPAGKVTEEQWSKMSPAQRLDYNRQFDQKQFYDANKRVA